MVVMTKLIPEDARGHMRCSKNGYYTGKGTSKPCRRYVKGHRGWSVGVSRICHILIALNLSGCHGTHYRLQLINRIKRIQGLQVHGPLYPGPSDFALGLRVTSDSDIRLLDITAYAFISP